MRLDQAQLHGQTGHPFECFLGVPVPEQMFHALQFLRYVSTGPGPLVLQCLGLLLQNCQPHGDVEPIDQVPC